MVSLGDDEGQVILVVSLAIALIIISLSFVFYSGGMYSNNYFESKTKDGDYFYYNVRDTYKKVLKELESNDSVTNPFNDSKLSVFEDELSNFCKRHGYFVSFRDKTFYPDSEEAAVTIIFSGQNLNYKERVRYEL